MAQKLSKLELEQIAEKPWQMKGEVSGSRRPVNSLLEADLDFDTGASTRAPVVTKEVTASIEQVLLQRISEQLWDDVVRLSSNGPRSTRPKPADISTEKSELGLGEQYERAYEQQMLGHASAETTKQQQAYDEIQKTLSSLLGRLDALFSAHAVPKAHKPEATVRSQSVAVATLEEATPTAMGAAEALAPEEVFQQRKTLKELAVRQELSQEERGALRRKKKRVRKRQGAETKEIDALRAKMSPNGGALRQSDAAVGQQLADAKRKGTVLSGSPSPGQGGRSPKDNASGGQQFIKSSKFFATMQGEKGENGAGRKRPRGDVAGEKPPQQAFKLKL